MLYRIFVSINAASGVVSAPYIRSFAHGRSTRHRRYLTCLDCARAEMRQAKARGSWEYEVGCYDPEEGQLSSVAIEAMLREAFVGQHGDMDLEPGDSLSVH